jgi:eukaryotic-like serine/threonine-protein kinase
LDWGRDDRPAINVSWEDAQMYVSWLRRITGKDYRLLTEAEWEYAARGRTEPGSYPRYFFGNDEAEIDQYVWSFQNSGGKTQPVGQKKPNAFGLYDMLGNVWQWVEDVPHDDYRGAPSDGRAWPEGGDISRRVRRGGSKGSFPGLPRSAVRISGDAGYSDNATGFRLGRTLSQ